MIVYIYIHIGLPIISKEGPKRSSFEVLGFAKVTWATLLQCWHDDQVILITQITLIIQS